MFKGNDMNEEENKKSEDFYNDENYGKNNHQKNQNSFFHESQKNTGPSSQEIKPIKSTENDSNKCFLNESILIKTKSKIIKNTENKRNEKPFIGMNSKGEVEFTSFLEEKEKTEYFCPQISEVYLDSEEFVDISGIQVNNHLNSLNSNDVNANNEFNSSEKLNNSNYSNKNGNISSSSNNSGISYGNTKLRNAINEENGINNNIFNSKDP